MALENTANDMIAAFELGQQHRREEQDRAQAKEDRAQAKEDRALKVSILKHQIDREKLTEQLEDWKVRTGAAGARFDALQGTPEADLTPQMTEGGVQPSSNLSAVVPQVATPAPANLRAVIQSLAGTRLAGQFGLGDSASAAASSEAPGGPVASGSWRPLPGVQAPTRLAAVDFPALPTEIAGGEPGFSRRPETREQLTRQAIAMKRAEMPFMKTSPGESIWDPSTREAIYTNPNDKTPSDEFSVNYIQPALELATKAKGSPLTAGEKLQVNLRTRQLYKQSDTDPAARAQLEMLRHLQILNAQGGAQVDVKPDSREFKIAQDLAYGKLTLPQFRMLYASRGNAGQAMKSAIYAKAGELNPGFNPAQFEMGFKMAGNPKIQQQLASMDNVLARVPDLLEMSDAAARSGIPALNKIILPGGLNLGGKRYSDFHTAQTAFADELSGALGFGSATDMSRQMGFDMTNPYLEPGQFRSALLNVVVPFVQTKRDTMLKGMGVYGQPGMNQYAPANSGGKGGGPGGGTGGAVRMMAPDGSIAMVAAGAVEAAKAKGAKVIQ